MNAFLIILALVIAGAIAYTIGPMWSAVVLLLLIFLD